MVVVMGDSAITQEAGIFPGVSLGGSLEIIHMADKTIQEVI